MIRGLRAERPPARDRGRLPDHEHRDRGRRHAPRAARPGPRVDDAVAPPRRPHREGRQGRGNASPPTSIPYALASTITAALEGALMLSRLYDDPAHMDRVVDHSSRTSRRSARRTGDHDPTTTTGTDDRTRPKACARARSPGPIRPASAFRLARARRLRTTRRDQTRRRVAAARGRAARPLARRARTRPHRLLGRRRRAAREPDGNDARRHRRDARRHRDGLRGVVDAARRRGLHDARAEHELRARDHAVDGTRPRRRTRRARRRTRRHHRSARLRRRREPVRAREVDMPRSSRSTR